MLVCTTILADVRFLEQGVAEQRKMTIFGSVG
jgi:hypothetical protein